MARKKKSPLTVSLVMPDGSDKSFPLAVALRLLCPISKNSHTYTVSEGQEIEYKDCSLYQGEKLLLKAENSSDCGC